MYRRCFVLFAAVSLALVVLPRASKAQGSAPGDVVVVHPADDGYPALVAAYAALHKGSAITKIVEIEEDDFAAITLTEKRAALRDQAARNALSLQQTALGMPHLAAPSLIEFSCFDPIRLLLLKQYVEFADGKTAAALSTLADALQIADALTVSGEFGRSFGNGIKLRLIEATARHLNQLSVIDCNRLAVTMRRELAQPDPFLAEVEADRKLQHESVNVQSMVKPLANNPDFERPGDTDQPWYVTNAECEEATRFLALNPAAAEMLTKSIFQRIDAFYDDVEARYAAFPTVPPDTLGPTRQTIVTGRLAADRLASRTVRFSTQPAGTEQFQIEKMMRIRACERLLAVHAAICAYRWEYGHLPASLADLKLRDLVLDPFFKSAVRLQAWK